MSWDKDEPWTVADGNGGALGGVVWALAFTAAMAAIVALAIWAKGLWR